MALIPKEGVTLEKINGYDCEFQIISINETEFNGSVSFKDPCIRFQFSDFQKNFPNKFPNKDELYNLMKSEVEKFTHDPSFYHHKARIGEKCERCGRIATHRDFTQFLP